MMQDVVSSLFGEPVYIGNLFVQCCVGALDKWSCGAHPESWRCDGGSLLWIVKHVTDIFVHRSDDGSLRALRLLGYFLVKITIEVAATSDHLYFSFTLLHFEVERAWRKVHIGLCAKTQQVVIAGITTADVSDGEAMLYLMEGLSQEKLEAVYGDGAYDDEYCRGAIYDRGARQVIPPQKNARLQGWDKIAELSERDEAVKRIRALGADGRAAWKREVGYHQRSLVETAMYRSKQIFGERLTSRKFRAQATEVAVRYQALNRMTLLGMPDSYKVEVTA